MPKVESPFPSKTDFYSKHGAGMLADHIMKVWKRRGYSQVKAQPVAIPGCLGKWGVQSNLVNGLPPARVDGRGRHGNHSTHGKVKLTPRVAVVEAVS